MTSEQQAAYIMAQAALLNAKVAGMVAENDFRQQNGQTIAYGEDEFNAVVKAEFSSLFHNSVIGFFRQH